MTDQKHLFSDQLKQTCKLTGARWASWLRRTEKGWEFALQDSPSKARQASLISYFQGSKPSAWLSGALSSGRTRSTGAADYAAALDCRRVYAFPCTGAQSVVLVGADDLSNDAQAFFRILAANSPAATTMPEVPVFEQTLSRIPETGTEVPFDPRSLLNWVLLTLSQTVPGEAGYIAVRYGDVLRVEAVWKYSKQAQGHEFSILDAPDLFEIVASRQGALYAPGAPLPAYAIGSALPWQVKSCLAAPIVIGQRVIGLAVLAAPWPVAYKPADLERAAWVLKRLAHGVENAMVFADVTRYLQRFALLNELASAASLGTDAREVARRMVEQLSGAFHTDLVMIFLLSADGKTLRELGGELKPSTINVPVEASIAGAVVETGLPVRVGNIQDVPRRYHFPTTVHSELAVPLKYRGMVNGAIILLSTERNAFSLQDEQLLVMIASQLAGLLENVHLLQETRERAGSLDLIHSVVQRVVGMNDRVEIAQLTSEMMAEYYGYECASVLVADESGEELINIGIGGLVASLVPAGVRISIRRGITGRVFRSGLSYLSADVSKEADYLPFPGWQGGSEMCVPLRDGDRIIGVINLESERKDAFSQNDLIMLESLAGILSSVLVNAQRYSELQVSVGNLERLYQELQERIASQRLAENRLLRSARLAAVGEMSAGLAHEINNPLTTIVGFVELALDELPENLPQREELALVLKEAQRARSVLRRMLDFSRPEENLRLPTNLNDLVDEVISLVQHVAQSDEIQIVVEPCPDLSTTQADPNQIKQVLFNLVHNALQAMSPGGRLIVSTAHQPYESQSGVTVSVKDSGKGISFEDQQRIFDPFYTTLPVGEGTGLGLAVSYGIVKEHGGHIDVDSQVGVGSCFTVWLPLAFEEEHV